MRKKPNEENPGSVKYHVKKRLMGWQQHLAGKTIGRIVNLT